MDPVTPTTTTPVGNWNIQTALAHIESMFALHDRRYEQRFEASQKEAHQALTALRQEIIHERELREVVAEKVKVAQELQNTEILRRLTELNHAHEEARKNWAMSLPRELFDQWKDENTKWKEQVNAMIANSTRMAEALSRVDSRVGTIETLANKLSGAVYLLGAMGLAGVIGLLISLARLTGFIKP